MICSNCQKEVNSKYCPNCGQEAGIKRIDGQYLKEELGHLFHFEKGIPYTIKVLMFRPGKNIRNYLINDRNQLVKPIFFLILTSLIYTFITHYFQVEEKYVAANDLQNTASGRMLIWIQSNYGYANMIMGVFIAFWLRIIFKKYQYNFYELLVMLCYLFGFSMLIFTLFAVIEGLIYVKVFKFAAWISIVYVVWAIGNFFDARKISSYLRSLLAFILGTITFYILLFSAGIVIDWIVE